ncbi:MAG: glutamine synthetase family protein [Sphingomonadales bacterium]
MSADLQLTDSFVSRFDLWNDDQVRQAREMLAAIESDGLEVVRFVFADQHGLTRGKAVHRDAAASMLVNGCTIVSTLILKDTAHRTVMPVWQAGAGMNVAKLTGAADLLMVPDPTTFRRLPWAKTNGWVLCDLYYPDGEAVALSTRSQLAKALDQLGQQGLAFMSGLELEFHLFRLLDRRLEATDCVQPAAAPQVGMLQHGYQYLTEIRYDELEPVFEKIRRALTALGLPLRSEEIEFGPSQLELTFGPQVGIVTADDALLAKAAIKQVCARLGYHATFMCRPQIANTFASGWHLHQSLIDAKTARNVFAPDNADAALSSLGQHYLAGLLDHASASCLLAAPTINAYKRYRPGSLAPDRIQWGRDNKGAMLRVINGPSPHVARIENRVGEPAANPYLYLASQILSGLDGIKRQILPPAPVEEPYASSARRLPKTMDEALQIFGGSDFYRRAFGNEFVNYFTTIKQAEVDRFHAEVTDWEQKEYFEMF